MNRDKIPMSAHGEEENAMEMEDVDARDRLIDIALTGRATPSITETEDADPAAALTAADREALAALGPANELIRRIVAWVDSGAPARSREDGSTELQDRAATSTVFDSKPESGPPAADFFELLARHRAFQLVDQVGWSSRYRKQEIGRGGQGVVYLLECLDPFFGKRAMKIYSPERYGDAQSYYEDMARMSPVASKVHQSWHDNLVPVDRFEAHHGVYMMVMRLIDGFDLQRLLDPDVMESLQRSVPEQRWADLNKVVFAPWGTGQRSLAPGIAANIIEKCLRGVSSLHENGIVHCDIKPSNIMLDCYGSIRLIDIGSAFHWKFPPRQHAWTPRYAPPEILEEKGWTPQSDLACIGYVLIELLSGRPEALGSYPTSKSVHALDKPARLALLEAKRRLLDRLEELIPKDAQRSDRLKQLLRKLIHPDPNARFDNAYEAIVATGEFKDELSRANLSVTWVHDIQCWVRNVKAALQKSDESK